jgi:hypothetical protein
LEDELGAFSEEQRDGIIKTIIRFDREYSLKLHVQTQKEIFTSTDAVSEGIFLGVCPSRGQVVIFMPPILRAALGEGVAAQMRDMVESAGFADTAWTEAAIKALLVLDANLERFGGS